MGPPTPEAQCVHLYNGGICSPPGKAVTRSGKSGHPLSDALEILSECWFWSAEKSGDDVDRRAGRREATQWCELRLHT